MVAGIKLESPAGFKSESVAGLNRNSQFDQALLLSGHERLEALPSSAGALA